MSVMDEDEAEYWMIVDDAMAEREQLKSRQDQKEWQLLQKALPEVGQEERMSVVAERNRMKKFAKDWLREDKRQKRLDAGDSGTTSDEYISASEECVL